MTLHHYRGPRRFSARTLQRLAAELPHYSRTMPSHQRVTGDISRYFRDTGVIRAAATVELAPADGLHVVNQIAPTPALRAARFPESFVHGLLDVLADREVPLLNVRLTLTNAAWLMGPPIPQAFRLVGRDAGARVNWALWDHGGNGAEDW